MRLVWCFFFFHLCRVTELKNHSNHFFLCFNQDSYGMAVDHLPLTYTLHSVSVGPTTRLTKALGLLLLRWLSSSPRGLPLSGQRRLKGRSPLQSPSAIYMRYPDR